MKAPGDVGEQIRRYYDALGEAEWDRLGTTIEGRASFAVHRQFLVDHAPGLGPGSRVLEIGAGPGRFTIELARLGCAVVVTDVSEVQLELNRARVIAAGLADMIEEWRILDVRDSGSLEAESFDLVVAYGGPLSYAFEDEQAALSGLVRATRPGGVVCASVMSTIGALRRHLPGVVEITRTLGAATNERIVATGDLRGLPREESSHVCRMFRSEEVLTLVADAPATLVGMSASGCMSLSAEADLAGIEADPAMWAWFIATEIAVCRDPGVVGAGTHVLFACAPHVTGARSVGERESDAD